MTLHLLPVGVEIQIDGRLAVGHLVRVGEAPLLPPRGRACGAAAAVGTDQHGARARTVTALGRYDLGLSLYLIERYQVLVRVSVADVSSALNPL